MEGLKIPIGAPLGQLTKDVNGAQTLLKKSVGQMNIDLARLKVSAETTLDPNKLANYNSKIQQLGNSIKQSTNVGKVGFDAMGNAVAQTGNGLTKAFSGLKTLAYIIPGLGIAGIFNLAFEAIGPLISKLEIFNKKLTATAEARKNIADAFAEGNKDAATEITTLKTLYEAATNVANSSETRAKAAKKLIDLYPETFAGATKEQIETGKLSDKYNELTTSIIAAARAKALSNKISESTAKILDADIAKVEAQTKANEAAAKVKGTKFQDIGMGVSTAITAEQQINLIRNSLKKELKEQDAIIAAQNTQIKLYESMSTAKAKIDAIVPQEKDKVMTAAQVAAAAKKEAIAREKALVLSGKKVIPQAQIELQPPTLDTFKNLDKEVKYFPLTVPVQPYFEPPPMSLADYFNTTVLPELQTSFTTFFDDILMHGKLSFETLGKSILNTFSSVLASEATKGLMDLLNPKAADGKGNMFSKIISSLGIGKGGEGGGGGTGGGGLLSALGPIAGIIGAVGILGGIFKKKDKSNPMLPDQSSVVSSTSVNSGAIGITGGQVVFEISGTNLIGVLTRAGAKLNRYGI